MPFGPKYSGSTPTKSEGLPRLPRPPPPNTPIHFSPSTRPQGQMASGQPQFGCCWVGFAQGRGQGTCLGFVGKVNPGRVSKFKERAETFFLIPHHDHVSGVFPSAIRRPLHLHPCGSQYYRPSAGPTRPDYPGWVRSGKLLVPCCRPGGRQPHGRRCSLSSAGTLVHPAHGTASVFASRGGGLYRVPLISPEVVGIPVVENKGVVWQDLSLCHSLSLGNPARLAYIAPFWCLV